MAIFGFGPPAQTPVPGQPVAQPAIRAAPPTEMQQSSNFTEVLKAPEVQAALIQFGINMLNPTYGGFGSNIGRSLGAAGAAAGRAAGQKAEREAAARQAQMKEREFGLAERRTVATEKRENRLSRGGGLTSMFSKPKPFSEWVTSLAQKQQEDSFNEIKAEDLLANPNWVNQQRQVWESLQQGGGGSTGGGVVPGGPARITSREEFDALPSGALFVNPADGTVKRKK